MLVKFLILFITLWGEATMAQPNPYFPNGAPQIVSDPPPPWEPGQTVQFSVFVNGWISDPNNVSQWFHGMSVIASSCWASVTPGPVPPPIYQTNGYWMWVNQGQLTFPGAFGNCPLSGQQIPGGFFFETTSGSTSGVLDNNPFNNWGDGSGFPQFNGSWTFTWSATVPTNITEPCTLSMQIRFFGDGETGSYTQTPIQNPCGLYAPNPIGGQEGSNTYYVIIPGGLYVESPVCVGEPVTANSLGISGNGLLAEWDFGGAQVLSGQHIGPYEIVYDSPGTKMIVRKLTDLIIGQSQWDTAYVEVFPLPSGTFVSSRDVACIAEPVTFQFTGDASAVSTYHWDFNGGIVVSGQISGPGPITVVWNTPGVRTVSLRTENSQCSSPVHQVNVDVRTTPPVNFSVPPSLCQNQSATFVLEGAATAFGYQWEFEQGFPATATGPGPHTVVWALAGNFNVKLTGFTPGCDPGVLQRVVTVRPKPVVDAGPNLSLCADNCATLTGFVSVGTGGCQFFWSPGVGLDNPGALSTLACPTQTTVYSLYAVCHGCTSNVDTVRIAVNAKPTALVLTPQVSYCMGSGGAQISTAAHGGAGPLYYLWQPADGLSDAFSPHPIASPTASTMYTLVVTDSMGCRSDPVVAYCEVHPVPTAIASPNAQPVKLCKNIDGSIEGQYLQGSGTGALGPMTFRWEPTTGLSCADCPAPFCTADSTTIYTLYVTDAFTGCVSPANGEYATVVVQVSPRPVAHAGPDLSLCPGESTVIGDVPTGGGPEYEYFWSPATGLSATNVQRPTAAPNFTTTYYLKVRSNGCESIADEVVVSVKPRPTPAVDAAVVNICTGDSAQLTALRPTGISPSAEVSYRWEPATGLNDPLSRTPRSGVTESTVYTLYVTADGCTADVFPTVRVLVAPPVKADADAGNRPGGYRYCQGDDVGIQLNATAEGTPPLTVRWTPAEGLSDPTALNPVARPAETTTYTLTVTQNATGCTATDTVKVVAIPTMGARVMTDKPKICAGDSATLSVEGGLGSAQALWQPSDGLACDRCATTKASPARTTVYTVTLKEAGCGIQKIFALEVSPQPKADMTISGDLHCPSNRVRFWDRSTDAGFRIWDFGDGNLSNDENPVHTYRAPGEYQITLSVTSADGFCSDTAVSKRKIRVGKGVFANFSTHPKPPIILTMPDAFVAFTDESQNAVHRLWDFGDGHRSSEIHPVHEYRRVGSFWVTLYATDEAGCTDTAFKGPFIIREPEMCELPNVFTPNGDGVNDWFFVDDAKCIFPLNGNLGSVPVHIAIRDRWGRVVFSQNAKRWDGRTENGKDCPAGVYYYTVTIGRDAPEQRHPDLEGDATQKSKRVYTGSVTLIR
jgi:gliding motility-associated-like protein